MKLKPYPKYKPSGIDWIGDIPEGWFKKRIKYVSKVNSDALPEDTDEIVEFYYIDIGNVTLENGFSRGEKITFSEAPSRARRIAKEGDTIVSTVRTYLKAIAYIDDYESELIASTGFAVVRPEDEIDRKYLYYSLCSERLVHTISAISVGVSYPAINASDLACIFLIFPNKAEQKKIADFLDKKTAQIDDLIQKKEEMINLLKEKRAAIINQAVTKGLDPNAKMKPSGIDWIGDIPEGWKKKRIKYVAHINARTLPENTDDNLEFYYIDIGNVSLEGGFTKGEKILFSEAPSRARRVVLKGDTIISTVRTYLKAIAYIEDDSEELIASTGFAVISPFDEINEKYFFNTLCSERVVQTISAFSVGVSYPAINASEIGDIFIVSPDKQGQEKITDYINKKIAEIDKLIKNVIDAIAKLREYRSSLITAAVTGKIDVREVSV